MEPGQLTAWAIEVVAHSAVATAIAMPWARHLELPHGRARRRLLAVLLALPLLTALPWPGPGAPRGAWLELERLTALPVLGPVTVGTLALAVAAVSAIATVWQEVAPSARRHGRPLERKDGPELPRELSDLGWTVELLDDPQPVVATSGRRSRPRLVVSRGALELFSPRELAAAVAHEAAHREPGRWRWSHLLFALRLAQLYNPVALWIFREWIVELEIACDRDAARTTGPRPLGRALVKLYERTPRRQVASRSILRRRVDVLRGIVTVDDRAVPATTVAGAATALALLLPWIG